MLFLMGRESSTFAYKSQPYSEAMVMHLVVTCTPFSMSIREQTGNIITFVQFEEGNTLTKTCNNAERGYESNDDSNMSPRLSNEESYAIDSGDESDHDIISTEIKEKSVT